MNAKEVLKHFEQRRDEMVKTIGEIVDIESPSGNVAQSVAVVDRIVEMFRALPIEIEVERTRTEEYGDHLIIRVFS